MKTKVLLDIDGVIANFYSEFARFLNETYECTLDINQEPKSYSFNNWGGGVDLVNMSEASNAWIMSGGILRIEPYVGLKSFSKKLHNKYEVAIVTARIGDWERPLPEDVNERIRKDTYKWLEQNGIPTGNLHFTHEKVKFCHENNIHIMIEDKLSTAVSASKNKLDTVLINRPSNSSDTELNRIYRANSFDEALSILGGLNNKPAAERKTYILKEQELMMLLNGLVSHGQEETYNAMKNKMFSVIQKIDDADEILMDQYDAVLKRARNLDINTDEDTELQGELYKLSTMLRTLAHETYREYLKEGKGRDSDRFLRLVG